MGDIAVVVLERLRNVIWIPGGTSRTGSDKHCAEEASARRAVGDFWNNRTPVTNQFRKCINKTGYVTSETKDNPGALPHTLKAGLLVFTPPNNPIDLRDWSQWWTFKFGASGRRPYGPRSSISRLDDHPVVYDICRDAEAKWTGKELPTEAEREFAARGGLEGAESAREPSSS